MDKWEETFKWVDYPIEEVTIEFVLEKKRSRWMRLLAWFGLAK